MNKSNIFTPAENINSMVSTPKSLLDFMAMNTSQKCIFAIADGTSGVRNTIYINKGKMRMESVIKTSGSADQNVHMITDGSDAYTWIDGFPTGFKMSLDKFKQQLPTDSQYQVGDINQKFDYKCESWAVDKSAFAVPTAIKFTSPGM